MKKGVSDGSVSVEADASVVKWLAGEEACDGGQQ